MFPSKREIERLRLSSYRRFRISDSSENRREKVIQAPDGYGWVSIPNEWDLDFDVEDDDDDEPEFPPEFD